MKWILLIYYKCFNDLILYDRLVNLNEITKLLLLNFLITLTHTQQQRLNITKIDI